MSNRRIPSLVEISTSKCIHNIGKLDDIGQTPFHLVQPILKKMTSKQLSQIEDNSPHLTPYTDSLWIDLIEKDFPDRPLYQSRTLARDNGLMPNKSLYFQYLKERELFRIDSTKRLRNITEELKLKKSKNSIVSVSELLRDPTVRKPRNYSYPGNSFRPYRSPAKSSILNKAMKDVQGRSIMFQNSLYNPRSRHNPYEAFNDRPISLRPGHHRSKVRFSPTWPPKQTRGSRTATLSSNTAFGSSLSHGPTSGPTRGLAPTSIPLMDQPTLSGPPNLGPRSASLTSLSLGPQLTSLAPPIPLGRSSPSSSDNLEPRPKVRKIHSSIFLSGQRRRPPPKRILPPKPEATTPPKKTYPIKSSIFH